MTSPVADTAPIHTIPLSELGIWDRAKKDRTLLSVTLELTARCNNNCAHCYINQPADDPAARKKELSFEQITGLIDEAVSLGALWVLLSGGEPLLRSDFSDIYLYLKKKGLLVSIFTNASLITQDHIDLFLKYPPRDIEVTVYGITPRVHAAVTRKNTFAATMAGIEKLTENPLPVTLKSTIMKSNVCEIDAIADFCRSLSTRPFRSDPFLHLRLDGDPEKNHQIRSQRLSREEITAIEKKDPARFEAITQACQAPLSPTSAESQSTKVFRCMAGINSCCIDPAGTFKLCSSLADSACSLDLTHHTLSRAWQEFTPTIIDMASSDPAFLDTCGTCTLHNICAWCPAHAHLETGRLDTHIPYYCRKPETGSGLHSCV